ncbi:acyltransferase family protein [Bradyrhizobium sp. CCBAU 51753]|uniref:acyltransferase family protein n=1 Tax=Bradyrhizobium sp. CCBAU 51753 TaxID=1325100 RepID=UPI00188BAAB6|nr:acyltransferase family protein [Bradyrhizobium sp. CCBAU 51753]QOZ26693.1 hypothetical protein XH93_26090 [Bradyrhizobium sp. CCBAU 51753]
MVETGYFDAAATSKPLLHLWSLGIEEQFYLVCPAFLWLAFRKKVVGRSLAVVFISSFGLNIFMSASSVADAFYLPVCRFWELAAGATLASLGQVAVPPKTRSWLSIAGFAALVVSLVMFTQDIRFPGWYALLPVAGAAAIILAGPEAGLNRMVLSHRAAVGIGLISYPLYLWHWPLISYAYIIRLGKPPTPLLAAALLALAFLLAWLTYRFVERPVRFGRQRNYTGLVAISLAAIGTGGLVIWVSGGFPERFSTSPQVDIGKIGSAKLDADFKPTSGMEVDGHGWGRIARVGHGVNKVALAGDSLVFQYGPRVQELADEKRLRTSVFFVVGPRCPPVPGVVQQDKFAGCAGLPDTLMALVQREKVQTVVLGAGWSGYSEKGMMIQRNGETLALNTSEGKEAFYSNLEDYIRALQSSGAKVYLVLGLPVHERFDPARMVARNAIGIHISPDVGRAVPMPELRSIQANTDEHLHRISTRTGATLLDPFYDICGSDEGCSPFFGEGEPKFSDFTHLRPIFVRQHLRFLDHLLE